MKRAAFAAACLFAVVALVSACGQPRRDTPYTEPVALRDPDVARGQQLFMFNCNQCHPGGAAGLAPGLNDKPLPAIAIKTQIRNGVGAMPAFDESRLIDADVDAIVKYLKSLRATRPPSHGQG
jgi:mono/diheme cytochrome c family protein